MQQTQKIKKKITGLTVKKQKLYFLIKKNKKTKEDTLTIRSGKNGPQIKKGIIEEIIKANL